MKSKKIIIAIGLFCIIATIIGIVLLGGIDRSQLQFWLQKMGIWAPVLYILIYSIERGDVLPIFVALALTGILIGTATWYRRRIG